jgi:hypothetical protein
MATGWTWDYVADSVDLPRLDALTKYWNKFPPVHQMVADYLGYGKTKQSDVSSITEVPVASVSKHEFEQLLVDFKLEIPDG